MAHHEDSSSLTQVEYNRPKLSWCLSTDDRHTRTHTHAHLPFRFEQLPLVTRQLLGNTLLASCDLTQQWWGNNLACCSSVLLHNLSSIHSTAIIIHWGRAISLFPQSATINSAAHKIRSSSRRRREKSKGKRSLEEPGAFCLNVSKSLTNFLCRHPSSVVPFDSAISAACNN